MNSLSFLIISNNDNDINTISGELGRLVRHPISMVVRDYLVLTETLKRRHFDIIICDYNMFGFSGLDVKLVLDEGGIRTPLFYILDITYVEKVAEDTLLGDVAGFILRKNLSNLCIKLKPIVSKLVTSRT